MSLFGSVLSGLVGLNASNKAHDRYNEGLGTAGQMLQQGLTDTESRLQPVAQYTPQVLERLNNILMKGDMSGFYNSPDYQYVLDQTTRGLNAKAAQQGTLISGNTLKELQKNAFGLASTNYNSFLNNLNNLFNQSNPYYSAYSQIPNLKGQAAANIQLGQTQNMSQAALDKGAGISNIISGIDEAITGALTGGLTGGFGGGSSGGLGGIFSSLFKGSGGGSSIPQFGSSYGFGGF